MDQISTVRKFWRLLPDELQDVSQGTCPLTTERGALDKNLFSAADNNTQTTALPLQFGH
jgi:hypothetical protein